MIGVRPFSFNESAICPGSAAHGLGYSKWTWTKPVYTKQVKHILPDSRKAIMVQAGTQYIDGFWRILRKNIRPWAHAKADLLRLLVRASQWRYWCRGKDLYIEGAKVIKNTL